MQEVHDALILGSGPAGWTAAIYAGRANLAPVLLEGMQPGGQLTITTDVENYPGFPDGVQGPEMMELFKKQATRFDTRVVSETGTEVDLNGPPFKVRTNLDNEFVCKTLIISTGASANYLGLENETKLQGRGVSACATCDGFFFQEKDVCVVGGGDSACEEATFLTRYATKVHMLVRRDQLRASKIMQQRAFDNPKIEILWNKVVVDVLGDDMITGVRLKDTQTDEESDLALSGLFMALGHTPITQFLNGQLDLDDDGYIKLQDTYRSTTNVEGVFAAGDVADSVYRQAITAAGMGCKAAIDAERWLAEQGIE